MSSETESKPFRAGMELEQPASFTPPEVRPGPQAWEKYHGPRFSRRVRIWTTIALWAGPALFVLLAASIVLLGAGEEDGRVRAAAVFFLMPLVPVTPLLVRATRDLWGSWR